MPPQFPGCSTGADFLQYWEDQLQRHGIPCKPAFSATLARRLTQCFRSGEVDGNRRLFNCLRGLSEAVVKRTASSFSVSQFAAVLHSFASLKYLNKEFLEFFKHNLDTFLLDAETHHLSTLTWALATFQSASKLSGGLLSSPPFSPLQLRPLLTRLDNESFFLCAFGSPREISTVLWALAKLKFPAPQTLYALDRTAKDFVASASPRDVSEVLYAVAQISSHCETMSETDRKNGHETEGKDGGGNEDEREKENERNGGNLREGGEAQEENRGERGNMGEGRKQGGEIERGGMREGGESEGQKERGDNRKKGEERHSEGPSPKRSLPFSYKFERPNPLVSALDAVLERVVEEGTMQDVGNTAWALCTLIPGLGTVCVPQLTSDVRSFFTAVDRQAEWLLSTTNRQELLNLLWSCVGLQVHFLVDRFLQGVQVSPWCILPGPNPSDVSMGLASLVKLYRSPFAWFLEIEKDPELVLGGDAQTLMNVVWSFAHRDIVVPGLFTAVDREAGERIVRTGQAKHICSVA
uniref:Uncharacterized protein n=1 Tax=Chromera velia CCMP2878 TaxID=1169474 RepID=A0A0G4FF76_9ALVE|eukprot:Cvel_16682.t1-p1 / transcript=Cvel_16682.t1 / gene=Cvel_16682 / organism=Chromera_velia_CCMP2878 / gene_product=hypothetical protein / transcript_product=hypothetical protein / location=Cvel_scaffold1295:12465-14030(+) / protein_length=522 / sequence_SO=supercontig / SO=protein_coding / is_pseudo=false